MKQHLPFPLLAAATLLPVGLAPAAVLFSDDFESYTVGNVPTTGAGQNWANATNTANSNVRVADQGTSAAFGNPNRFVNFNDTNNTASNRFQSNTHAAASNAVTTFSFDFFEPSTGGNSNMGVGYAINNSDLLSASLRQRITMNNGTISGLATTGTNTYSLATAYRLFMIFNDTASPVSYQGGSIASGVADIWLRDAGGAYVFVGTSNAENTATEETSYSVAFRSFANDIQNVYLDNVLFETGAAAIPEPSAALLGGFGALALLRRRR